MTRFSNRHTPLFPAILVVVAVAAIASAGCGRRGPARATVHGTVTFEGEPVPAGFVIFENRGTGWTRSDALTGQGSYRLIELPVDEYVVRIIPPEPEMRDERTGYRGGDRPPLPDPKNIPQAYREAASTPLRATVVKGTNRCDFDLR